MSFRITAPAAYVYLRLNRQILPALRISSDLELSLFKSMSKQENTKTVFVGLSGGVDSSVTALRLKERGFNVVGVFIKVWHPDFLECNWEEERLDAMRVAAKLNIPFLTCDAEEEYKTGVGEYFVNEYLAGRTPNPDVMCNREVKFGAFLRFAKEHGADYIATGHYAQVKSDDGIFRLYRGADPEKDQSYFLWTLTQEELAFTLLPVGDSLKPDIRAEALKAGLNTAKKKDSQGICFLGQVDIPEFISHFTDLKEGAVLDTEGQAIGRHKGALVYTLGQRHGFTIDHPDYQSEPHYVVGKDVINNTIVAATAPPIAHASEVVRLEKTNWIVSEPEKGKTFMAQIRHRQTPFEVELKKVDGEWTVIFTKAQEKPSSGQSLVLYDGEECIGGGIIA